MLTRGDQSEARPGWGQYNVQCVLLSQMSSSCEGRTVRRNKAHVGRTYSTVWVSLVTSISILTASQDFKFQLSSKLISPWIKICQIQSLSPGPSTFKTKSIFWPYVRVLCIGGQTPDYTILSLDRASYFPDIDVTLGMAVKCRYIFALLWLADSSEYWSLIGPGRTRNKANRIQFVATELPTYLLKAVVSKLNNNYVFWTPLTECRV